MGLPIWKDVIVALPEGAHDFRITLNDEDGDIIYSGKAYERPGEGTPSIRINDIVADYIKQSLPTWSQDFTPEAFSMTFAVLAYDEEDEEWQLVDDYTFDYDWSYDYGYDADTDGYSFPIRHDVDARQFIPITFNDPDMPSIPATVFFKDGTSLIKVITVARTADFNDDYNEDFAVFEMAATTGTAVVDLTDYVDVDHVNILGQTFYVDSDICHNYVLYYVNAYGGWDALHLKGRVSEKDSYTRHTHAMEYNNATIQGRGTRNYVNEVTKTFTLNTGWINDEGASRMHHLLGSTLVVLHDLVSGDIMPVVLTNADCPYKTYGGEGNRLINYTIEATLAQERVRR